MFQTSIALVIFLFPLAYSPGPGNMFFAANGARFGYQATLPANLGYHVATLMVAAGIGFGFVAVLDHFPGLFLGLKVAGSLYVLWLAWSLFRAGAIDGAQAASPAGFWDGVMLLVLNPKAYVIMALMFAQFLQGAQADHSLRVALIVGIFTVNNFVAFLFWTLVGDRIARQFSTEENAQRLNATLAVILAAVALWMLLT